MNTNSFPLQPIVEIAYQAGEDILEIYDDKRLFISSRIKKEKSPYTIAKLRAEELIVKLLTELDNSIPVISEHHNKTSFYYRKVWEKFWLVDALNGTREFLKQTNEFTINIALVENGVPVLGIVYAPALSLLYAANQSEGAFRIHKNKKTKIKCNKNPKFLVAVSGLLESPNEEEEKKQLAGYPIMKIISAGSSLRFARVADGSADIYYRHAPTMEWETAAGEAIVTISGGKVKHLRTKDFRYNKQMLKNKSFICVGDSEIIFEKSTEQITL